MTYSQRRSLFETLSRAGMFYSKTIVNLDSLLTPYVEAKERVQARAVTDELLPDTLLELDIGLGPGP